MGGPDDPDEGDDADPPPDLDPGRMVEDAEDRDVADGEGRDRFGID